MRLQKIYFSRFLIKNYNKIPNGILSFTQFLINITRKYRANLIVVLLCLLSAAISRVLSSFFLKLIINEVSINAADGRVFLLCTILLLAISISEIFKKNANNILLKKLPHIRETAILEAFQYLQNHSYAYFATYLAGSIASKIKDLAKGIGYSISIIFEGIIFQAFIIIIACMILFYIHPVFSLVLIAWVTILMIMIFKRSQKSYKLSINFSRFQAVCIGKVVDSLSNILLVKSFVQEEYEKNYIRTTLEKLVHLEEKFIEVQSITKWLQGIMCIFLVFVMLVILLYLWSKKLVTSGDFALVLFLSLNISQGLLF